MLRVNKFLGLNLRTVMKICEINGYNDWGGGGENGEIREVRKVTFDAGGIWSEKEFHPQQQATTTFAHLIYASPFYTKRYFTSEETTLFLPPFFLKFYNLLYYEQLKVCLYKNL